MGKGGPLTCPKGMVTVGIPAASSVWPGEFFEGKARCQKPWYMPVSRADLGVGTCPDTPPTHTHTPQPPSA